MSWTDWPAYYVECVRGRKRGVSRESPREMRSSHGRPRQGPWVRTLLSALGWALGYLVLSAVGLRWAPLGGAASPMYPAAGVALAGLVLGGLRLWPAVFLGRMAAFLVDSSSLPLWVQVAIAGGNTLAAVAGAMALERVGLNPSLPRLRDMLALIAAALGASALAATAGASALTGTLGHGLGRAGVTWLHWWTSDVIGILLVTPLVLSWARGEPEGRGLGWWLHLTLSAGVAIAMAWLVFGPTASPLLRSWLIFPALIWAALASGVRGASAALAPVMVLSIWGTARGYGPFATTIGATEALRLVLLQQFVGAAAVTTLVLAVVADERRHSEVLRQNEEWLRRACRAGRIGLWEWNTTTGAAFWSPEAYELFGHERGCTVDYDRWMESVHPEDRESAARAAHQALDQARSDPDKAHYKDEYRILHGDGATLWVEASGAFERKEGHLVVLGVVRDITDRRLAEVALHASEERFHIVARAANDAIWDWDLATNTIWWNDGVQTLFGYAPAEVHPDASWWYDHIHPGDRERVVAGIHAVIESREAFWRDEYRYRRADGAYSEIWDRGYVIRDAAGQAVRMLGAMQDVTGRRRADEALRASEERFRGTFDNAAVGIAHVASDGRWLLMNAKLCEITGYSREELLARTFQDITHPDDLRADLEQARRLLARELPMYSLEKRYIRKDGGIVWVHLTISLVRKPSGEPDYFISVIADITARKQAEAALRESEARFRALADNISQLAWMTDESGWIFWYNRRWFEYTGTTLEEMAGWGWQKVHHPDHVGRVTEKFRYHIAHGGPWEDTFPLRGKDGEYRWFLSRALPIRDDAGRIVRWFGTNTDITAQREAEETLRRALQLRDEFLSVASHELRTPLTALGLQLEGLQKLLTRGEDADGQRLAKRVDMAIRQSRRLGTLVEGLLHVSRLAFGQLQIELQTFDLRELIRETVDRFGEVASRAQCEIRLQLGDEVVGTWDRSRLDQVLMNLLSNAIKYGPGSPVEVGLEANDRWVAITVRDRGIGVPEADQERIFGRFERAVSVRHYGGLGLGLYIARQIVEAHGGSIDVRSAAGAGATFVVRLPRVTRPNLAAVKAFPEVDARS
ncbi:MAG TPA: PAS domain S-box protein [Polyangia bacterium]|nr:PAS domain S-box protein [Polyangia bacterium]